MEQDGLAFVGEYRRELAASLARMFENALDWEHLPHLHSGSFTAIDLIEADADGWRAKTKIVGGKAPLDLDLRLDPNLEHGAGRWVTTTRAGDRVLSRIVTDAVATGARSCRIHVRFEVAGVADAQRTAVGAYYAELYAKLYDEDESMMLARQRAIDAPDRSFRNAGEFRLPRACPHFGLPLDAEPDADGIVTCPWHGYSFDARTGRCVSGGNCSWRVQP